jgi:hypothetical protein
MKLIAVALTCIWYVPALAAGFTFGSGGHPYPSEPQYQYPRTDGKAQRCPKGQAPYQGKCRKIRRPY